MADSKISYLPSHGQGMQPPSGSDGMEARIAKLESAVTHIESDIKDLKSDAREIKRDAREDFRILFGAIIVSALGLAALLAKGFHWI